MVDVIPGILEKEWGEIVRKIGLVAPYVPWVQIDILDDTLFPNSTFLEYRKDMLIPFVKRSDTEGPLGFEAHLMVANPEKFIKPLVDAGFTRLITHVESNDPRRFLDEAHYESVEVGIAVDGPTEFIEIEPFLEEVDFVLVMTIEAGYSGQPFLPETIDKIKNIHEAVPDLPIEVDGGIDDKTARLAKDAGATRLVSTTYIFQNPDNIHHAIERLKRA
jgi:ribulose-phosphate 3-epimerase